MKTTHSVIRSAVLAFAVAVALSAHAATTTTTKQSTTVPVTKKKALAAAGAVSSNPNALGLLDRAYGLLRRADHDYKGHRVHAMHAIEAAARELGGKLGGGGKGDEAQGTSDSQLKSAQSILQHAAGELARKPLRHVEAALKQLSIALRIK